MSPLRPQNLCARVRNRIPSIVARVRGPVVAHLVLEPKHCFLDLVTGSATSVRIRRIRHGRAIDGERRQPYRRPTIQFALGTLGGRQTLTPRAPETARRGHEADHGRRGRDVARGRRCDGRGHTSARARVQGQAVCSGRRTCRNESIYAKTCRHGESATRGSLQRIERDIDSSSVHTFTSFTSTLIGSM